MVAFKLLKYMAPKANRDWIPSLVPRHSAHRSCWEIVALESEPLGAKAKH